MGNGAGCSATAVAPVHSARYKERQVDIRGLISVAKCAPFRVPKGTSGEGECMLFLENIRHPRCNVQVVARVRKRGDPYGDDTPTSAGDTTDSDAAPCGELRWPARCCLGASSWYSAQPLGVPINEREAYELDFELRQGSVKLGGAQVPLDEPSLHCQMGVDVLPDAISRRTLTRKTGDSKVMVSYSLCFQLVDSRAVMHKKTVIFIRHAESVWNEAQSKKQFHKMAQETDHPLSARGRQQAEELAKKLMHAVSTQKEEHRASLGAVLDPDVVFVSPLTRAVQTSVISLGPLLCRPEGLGQLHLLPSAREKQNLGGMDTVSRKTGSNILHHVYDKLKEQYRDKADDVVGTFSRLHFNTQQVEEQWWTDGPVESKEDVQARVRELMSQLLYAPQRNIVVIGHSHLFRTAVGSYMSDEFRAREPELSRRFTTDKLQNCGVLRLELDPSKGVGGGPITDAQLLFDSQLVK